MYHLSWLTADAATPYGNCRVGYRKKKSIFFGVGLTPARERYFYKRQAVLYIVYVSFFIKKSTVAIAIQLHSYTRACTTYDSTARA